MERVRVEALQYHTYDGQTYHAGDVYDAETHAQFFYHAHPAEQRRSGEHGHFHCFLRPRGMPAQ